MMLAIGIGSNIDPGKNIRAAATHLKELWPDIRFSSVWRSKPREVEDQPDFLNAVATFDTTQELYKIFVQLSALEKGLKKDIQFRYGPRTIDLDALLVGNLVLPSVEEWKRHSTFDIRHSILIVPHPRMHERRFVLEPLIELVGGELLHPVFKKPLKEFLSEVKEQECEKTRMTLP